MMKRTVLTLCISMLTATNIMFGDIDITLTDYIPLPGTSRAAFEIAYERAMEAIYILRNQRMAYEKNKFLPKPYGIPTAYSVDYKKNAVKKIIELSYDMVDVIFSVAKRVFSSDKVKKLKNYVKQEIDKMNARLPDAIKNNDFNEIADIAEKLIWHLELKKREEVF